jgi:hypothetical protein
MPQPTFKLNTSTIAILHENAQPRIVTIEANALVTLVDGDAEAKWVCQKFVARTRFYQYSRLTFVVVANESWGSRLRWGTPA